MNYQKAVGQAVVGVFDKKKGVIQEVDADNRVHIKYGEEPIAKGYLYDPFLEEQVRFLDPAWQKQVDAKINEIAEEQKKMIDSYRAAGKKDEKYFVTLANPDGSLEKVLSLNCSEDQARDAFDYVVRRQERVFKAAGGKLKWRQVKLFDAITGEQLDQAS